VSEDFDNMAVVVDWLDACRTENLDALLDCFADDAGFACRCDGIDAVGRSGLEAYWRPRLSNFSPAAFALEEIKPIAEGVMLEYLNHDGKPVKVVFAFNADGKIASMRCEPASR
jgi:ketosteroid isomerase-like protein